MNLRQLEKVIIDQLEDKTLEEFLEQFDVTPLEAVNVLFEEGYLDPDLLEVMLPVDGA